MQFTLWAEPVDTIGESSLELSVRVERKALGASPGERCLWAALGAHLIKAVEATAGPAIDRLRGARVTVAAQGQDSGEMYLRTTYHVEVYIDADIACWEIDRSAAAFWAAYNDVSPEKGLLLGSTHCYGAALGTPGRDRCAATLQ